MSIAKDLQKQEEIILKKIFNYFYYLTNTWEL